MPSSCSRPITTGSLLTAGPVTGSPLPSGQISLFLLIKTCLNPQARNFQISPRLWTCQHFCGNSAISAAFVIPASRQRDRFRLHKEQQEGGKEGQMLLLLCVF